MGNAASMPAVVSYGIRLVSRAICISSVLTSSRSVSRSACSAELFVFCSYSEYLAASEKYRRMQSGRLQKARSLRCRPQTPTRRGSRRDRRCSITGKPGLGIPSFADRKFGAAGEWELRVTFKPDDLVRAIEGMEAMWKAGLRYPMASHSLTTDVCPGMPPHYLEF